MTPGPYTIHEINPPGHELTAFDGGRFDPAAARSVVGWFKPRMGVGRHAFLWEMEWSGDTQFTDLGVLEGGTWSKATGVCEGLIVGSADTADGTTHGFVYFGGRMYDVNDLTYPQFGGMEPPTILELTGVARPGLCVAIGCASVPGSDEVFGVLLWGVEATSLHVVNLGHLVGAFDCVPMDIQGFAGIVGHSGGRAFHYGLSELGATRWMIQDLSPGQKGSSGNGIMELNTGDAVVVGCVGTKPPFSPTEGIVPEAALWWKGVRFDLPLTGAIASEATDVGYYGPSVDRFGAVGWFQPQGSPDHHATMWAIQRYGGLQIEQIDLHQYLDGMVESEAVELGDYGDVLVNAHGLGPYGQAFLMIPDR